MPLDTPTLTAEEQTWLEAYQQALDDQFPGLIKNFVIFGSKARGSSHQDSDLDILVVIQEGDWKTKKTVAEPGYLLAIGTQVVPSLIVLTHEEWANHKAHQAPFWQTVTRDGITVL